MSNGFAGRIALVTGASRGIGYALSKLIAAKGAHVIAVARTVGGLEELDDEIKSIGGTSTLVPLDLRDFDAIDRLGESIFDRWNKLDILVGNAGILGSLSPIGHIEPQIFEEVIAVNLIANWRLIRSLDPLLRNSKSARGIFISSSAAKDCKPYWSAYSASKSGLETLVRTYAIEIEKVSNIKVNLVDPGPIRTAMRAKAMPGENPETLTTAEQLAESIIPLLMPTFDQTGVLYDFRSNKFKNFKTTL